MDNWRNGWVGETGSNHHRFISGPPFCSILGYGLGKNDEPEATQDAHDMHNWICLNGKHRRVLLHSAIPTETEGDQIPRHYVHAEKNGFFERIAKNIQRPGSMILRFLVPLFFHYRP